MKKSFVTYSFATLTALAIVWGVLVSAQWVGEYLATKQSPAYETLPFEFKLKAAPEDVIFSEAYQTEEGNDIVRYAYAAQEVGPQLNEDIARRTPASYTEVVDTFKDAEGRDMETLKTTFLAEPQFYQTEGVWRQVEYATTTPEIFALSGAIPHVKRRELVERLLPGAPVFAVTSTFYPDADTETNSVDGVLSSVKFGFGGCILTTFDSARTATDAFSANDLNTTALIKSYFDYDGVSTCNATVDRSFFLFNTASLGSGATISSATFSVYVTAKDNTANDGYDYIQLHTSSPASNTALVVADFDQVGTTEQSDTSADITSISTSAYSSFTLNATGLSNIAKTGVTKFSLKEGHDISGIAPCSYCTSSITVSTADHTGTTQDPKLEVTYTAALFSFGSWFPF